MNVVHKITQRNDIRRYAGIIPCLIRNSINTVPMPIILVFDSYNAVIVKELSDVDDCFNLTLYDSSNRIIKSSRFNSFEELITELNYIYDNAAKACRIPDEDSDENIEETDNAVNDDRITVTLTKSQCICLADVIHSFLDTASSNVIRLYSKSKCCSDSIAANDIVAHKFKKVIRKRNLDAQIDHIYDTRFILEDILVALSDKIASNK